ncbi:hypothetical protein DEQ92_20210 [Haloferax sp. Atlit-6N]|uniref:hypothetical protein n=1 Tax=Haloferax sp. Atlit-6N TaxID=2077205 RepID=UPI000E237913|nr:hypothetical protein [Haloferax sp. Atlit-6N]REA00180.1 hypothetical protein DEQ92_20210 [Haloferax sp. Atlit-6N]
MPLRTQRYDLTDEIERIDDELADLKATRQDLIDADEDKRDAIGQVNQRITTLEAEQRGARWARDEAHLSPSEGGVEVWDHSVDTLEFAALSAGEIAEIFSEITNRTQRVVNIHMVAQGTVDAPYHDSDASYDERVETVGGGLPAAFVKFAYNRINSLSTVGNPAGTASKRSPAETRSQTPTSN